MIIDYIQTKECQKNDWYTCYKCGKCGREFEDGFMVDHDGTTIQEDEE